MEKINTSGHVLIVDSSSLVLNTIYNVLSPEYRVECAMSGYEALEVLSTKAIDLALIDSSLPDINGYNLCRQMKKNDHWQDIPVIFLSDQKEIQNQLVGFSLGAIDYMIKPIEPLLLKARLKNYISLKKYYDKLKRQSLFDELTKLPNRRYFYKVIKQEWKMACTKEMCISLLFLDIDFFKEYNDFYGHVAGDVCLNKIAKALKKSIHHTHDLAARYGGEEFVIILPHTRMDGAIQVAQYVRSNIDALAIRQAETIPFSYITVSVGVTSIIPKNKCKVLDFIRLADKAMYQSKKRGRDQITILNE
jgi:diguanylate cyclase (GGDEF)-like protein